MKNNIDKLWDNFKNNNDLDEKYKKDVEIIDKCIIEENIELKKKFLKETEEKYKEILDARGYFKVKNMVDAKTYMVNNEKELNTLLGNLKLWIVRIAYLENNPTHEIKELYYSINKERDPDKIYKLLDKADGLML